MFFTRIGSAVIADCNLKDRFRNLSFGVIDEFHIILDDIYHVIIEFLIFRGAVADTFAGDNTVVLWIFGNFIQDTVSKVLLNNSFGNSLFVVYAERAVFGDVCNIVLNRSKQSAKVQVLTSAGSCKYDPVFFQCANLVENNWIYIMCAVLK